MSHHDELKWVHPDHHEEVMKSSNEEAKPKCRSGMPVVESTNHESHGMGHIPLETHLVYVNFYTYEDAKQVRMILNEYTAFDDILQKANELLPTCK